MVKTTETSRGQSTTTMTKKGTDISKMTATRKKKITREKAKQNQTTRVTYEMLPLTCRKNIQYSHYVKRLEKKGDLFSNNNNGPTTTTGREGSDHDDGENNGNKKKRTCIIRFKKDAKVVLERLLITWLRRITAECKRICTLESLSKIKEKNVYTQIRLSFPPSEQKELIDYCKKALGSYVSSKVATSKAKNASIVEKATNEVNSLV